jgi:lipoprotein-releasing system permease protein
MYKLHLILKYLRKRRIAWVSLIAVTLCTAMVLVVISVMGGWLRMFRETNHSLVGDIIVSRVSSEGFPYYREMIDRIEALPEVKAAAPEIHAPAILNMSNIRRGVEVIGYDIKKTAQVNGFARSLYLQPEVLNAMADQREKAANSAEFPGEKENDLADAAAMRAKAKSFPSWDKPLSDETYKSVLVGPKAGDVTAWPGIIAGVGAILQPDDKDGKIHRKDWLYRVYGTLTVVNIAESASGGMSLDSATPRNYWLIDDSHTGVFPVDQNTVYVPFDILQKDLKMNDDSYPDTDTGKTVVLLGHCNEIHIGLKPGFSPDAVQPKIEQIVSGIVAAHQLAFPDADPIVTETWELRQGEILAAVEHEKVLLVVLFAIISVVAIFLIFCIFYMIVVEKTRDIGIIKSVGATSAGVAGIFLGYGLVIGLLGAGVGLLLGFLLVHNINQLHAEMAKVMGIKIWDAKTYVFDTIPNTMETRDVVVIVSIAILSSVLGAIVPAIRAARLSPVEALRWE